MLPPPLRMRSRADFSRVARAGERAARGALIVSMVRQAGDSPPRVGIIVGRRVGGAVARNRVRRQLRHLLAERAGTFPRGALVVVRARPGIADQHRRAVVAALDQALAALDLVAAADVGGSGLGMTVHR